MDIYLLQALSLVRIIKKLHPSRTYWWVRVKFFWPGSGPVSHLWFIWVWIWKISPKNVKFFNFFPFGSKKISSGRVKKYPGQRQVGLLFTAKVVLVPFLPILTILICTNHFYQFWCTDWYIIFRFFLVLLRS